MSRIICITLAILAALGAMYFGITQNVTTPQYGIPVLLVFTLSIRYVAWTLLFPPARARAR